MKEKAVELLQPIDDCRPEAIEKLTNWLCRICRKTNVKRGDIFISYCRHKDHHGEMRETTLICVVNHLPKSPLISIPKRPEDITLEDVLSCYRLINYCGHRDEGKDLLN